MANLRADILTGTGGRNAIDGSVYFDNYTNSINDYLELADQADLEFGSGDYTVEFWCLPARDDAVEEIVNKGYPFQIYRNNKAFTLAVDSNTSSYEINTAFGSGDAGEWHHIAVARSGNTTKCFLNGLQGLSSTANTSIYDSSSKFSIGRYSDSASYKYQGYVSNLRIVKGTALYTASFTPPTEKLTIVDGTVLLCCQDTDNPTQEATGKTIIAYGGFRQDKTEGNLLTNTLDWDGAASSYSTTMPSNWTAGNGAQVQYESGGTSGGATNRKLRLRNDGSNSYIYQTIPTVIGQKYQIDLWYEAQNSSLAVKWLAGTSAAGTQNGSEQWNVGSDGTQATRTGIFNASATTTYITFQIISGTNDASVFIDDIQVKAVNPKEPKVLPSVGVDAGVVFDGDTKVNSQGYMYFPTGYTSQRGRGRAVIWMGIGDSSANYTKNIDYIEISTLGNTIGFGEISDTVGLGAAISSSTRGVMAGGSKPGGGGGNQNFLEYVTIATTGNAKDFGGVSTTFRYGAGISNQTRGLIAGAYQGGGAGGTLNTIQYLTIATTGDTLDFGDMVADGGTGIQGAGATSSPTRGITFGAGTPTTINEINYITIMSTGNSVDFGDLSATRYLCQGVSDGTRGVVAGGDNSGAVNIIEYITIATTGNATDFGDLSSISEFAGGTGGSNKIRGVFVGRGDWTTTSNSISYITIATTGNAEDFGDVRTGFSNYGSNALSDSHGGLS